jgi:hypothetical protein
MVAGNVGSLNDPQLFWSQAEASTMGRMRIMRSSGPRLPVSALRCSACGLVQLFAVG